MLIKFYSGFGVHRGKFEVHAAKARRRLRSKLADVSGESWTRALLSCGLALACVDGGCKAEEPCGAHLQQWAFLWVLCVHVTITDSIYLF